LIDGIQDAGYINAIWDGKNRLAQQVATGMYIYRIEAKSIFSNDGLVSNKKMLLLK
jgi:flagellar hook assembly protein FlgD